MIEIIVRHKTIAVWYIDELESIFDDEEIKDQLKAEIVYSA